jgi:tetratricopeptide (TPR) repeat protein
VASFISYRSEQLLKESVLEFTQNKLGPSTLDKLERSGRLNPHFQRYLGKAALLAAQGHASEAEETLREAARREPENVRVWLEWSRIRVQRGRLEAAREAYARAKELDSQLPRTPLPPG